MAKTKTHDELEAPTFFVLRSPLLACEWLDAWSEGLRTRTAFERGEDIGEALAADTAQLTAGIWRQAEVPAVRDAIRCATPTLDDALDAHNADPKSARAQGSVPILVRYLVRMTTRPTPFGLFSGCTLGRIGDATRLEIPPHAGYVRHSRLDMHYLTALVEALEPDPDLRAALTFAPNLAMYESAGQLRYAEARTDADTRARSHHLVSVEVSDALRVGLAAAAGGAPMRAIAEAIAASDDEVSVEEAEEFVGQLVDSQVLVSSIAPPVTGLEPMPALIQSLRGAGPRGHEVVRVLEDVSNKIRALDEGGLGASRALYEDVAERLRSLPAKVELPRLFQVDLYKPAPDMTLGPRFVDEVIQALDMLRDLAYPLEHNDLKNFRQAFYTRYEGRMVRLTEALDEERGIGFGSSGGEPSPLLEGFVFPGRGEAPKPTIDARDQWLIRRFNDLMVDRPLEWELSDDDLKTLRRPVRGDLPDSFAVFGTIAAASAAAIDEGQFSFSMHLTGPSGANILGRFCHGDEPMTREVEAHLRAEEALRPGAVFAEIVHLSEGRLGNILCRPVLRPYEIPYLCSSGVDKDHQVPIGDLYLSVQGARIVLWSERLDREVIPRMSNAHNFSASNLGIYRLLCRLQSQDVRSGLGWSWGPLDSASYLPRVRRGRFVLEPAQWTLLTKDIEPLKKEQGAKLFKAVQEIRERLHLPRHVAVADGDNVMPIDFDNILSIETFSSMLKHRGAVTLKEKYPARDELCVRGPEGRFFNEFVLPFIRKREPTPALAPIARPRKKRSFSPGTEWLYFKLYSGTSTVDPLLIDVTMPLVREALETGLADGWFFIRYGDPDWHLRVRFRGAPAKLAELRNRLEAAFTVALDDGIVHRVSLDTYHREMERYGGDEGMEICEEIFQHDSEAVAEIVNLYTGDEGATPRWQLCFAGMHRILVDLGLDLDQRIATMSDVRKGFGAEFAVNVYFEKQLGARFRKERAILEQIVNGEVPEDHVLTPGLGVLARRSEAAAKANAELVARGKADKLSPPVTEIAQSLLHMHANRLLTDEARAQELILYDFLLRVYESQKARSKPKAGKGKPDPGTPS